MLVLHGHATCTRTSVLHSNLLRNNEYIFPSGLHSLQWRVCGKTQIYEVECSHVKKEATQNYGVPAKAVGVFAQQAKECSTCKVQELVNLKSI